MRPRSLVWTDEYVAAKNKVIKELGIDTNAFDDFHGTFDLVLARLPDLYPVVLDDLSVRMYRTVPGLIPSLRIWYSFDKQNIYLLYIAAVKDGQPEEE